MINSRRQLIILASAILTVAVTIVPSLWFMMTDARNRAAELGAVSESSARDRTRLMRAFFGALDSHAANLANVIASAFETYDHDFDYWHRIYSNVLLSSPNMYDIILAEPDGMVVASGRLDTPISIERILAAGSAPTHCKVRRLPSFTEYPYENGVMPYMIGVEPDENGTCRYAVVVLLDSKAFKRCATDLRIDQSIDLCVLDNSGKVLFRYPDSLATMMPGERVPGHVWDAMLAAASAGSTELIDSNGTSRVMCVAPLEDENGELVGLASASFVKDFLVHKILGANPIDPGFSPLPVVLAAAAGGIVVGVLLMRRLILDTAIIAADEPKTTIKIKRDAPIDRAIFDRDIITDTYGRQKGIALIDDMIASADDKSRGVSLLYCRLIGLRDTNTGEISPIEDAVLSEAADALKSIAPHGSVTCRYAEDVFIIAVPNANISVIEALRDRAVASLSVLSLAEMNGDIAAMCGVAACDPSAKVAAKELIDAAESKMLGHGAEA